MLSKTILSFIILALSSNYATAQDQSDLATVLAVQQTMIKAQAKELSDLKAALKAQDEKYKLAQKELNDEITALRDKVTAEDKKLTDSIAGLSQTTSNLSKSQESISQRIATAELVTGRFGFLVDGTLKLDGSFVVEGFFRSASLAAGPLWSNENGVLIGSKLTVFGPIDGWLE